MPERDRAAENPTFVRVDFFSDTGKWKYGGEIWLDLTKVFGGVDIRQLIVDHQDIIIDGWQGNYTVVTDNANDSGSFCKYLISAEKFVGMKRNEEIVRLRYKKKLSDAKEQVNRLEQSILDHEAKCPHDQGWVIDDPDDEFSFVICRGCGMHQGRVKEIKQKI